MSDEARAAFVRDLVRTHTPEELAEKLTTYMELHDNTMRAYTQTKEYNAELRERLRFHDTFLSTVRAACLKAQGIEKDKLLGVRAVADRGLRIIFDKDEGGQ